MNSQDFFGKLTFEVLQHDAIITATSFGMGMTSLLVIALFTYFKKWGYLWKEWLTSLDPKRIGMMYFMIASVMLFKGVVDASMVRAQQIFSVGEATGFLTSSHFQQVLTAHGTTMIFFVGMGFVFGMLNLIVPLQIGARDVAYPFLNALSFWLFTVGAVLVNVSLPIGQFSAAGWLAYPPLSSLEYSPDVGVDYWIWSVQISGIGSLLSGINFLVTILKMRAPGMTLMKMPLFVWSALNSMILVIFAFPILTATLLMLSLDRLIGSHFFSAAYGGNAMMYVNLIWAWGHPEVYILILPAFGVFSEVVATFSRKRLFGYGTMVFALLAITVLSFVVWLHHFFTMGAGANVNAFFGIMTMFIAIPTGVKVFNWLFTMYQGKISFSLPMLWFLGFLTVFTTGGMTGVLMAVPGADFQVHNSLFLIAHFHSMVIGGVLFGFFAAINYWCPKFFGFKLNEPIGRAAFWCWIIGFFVAFMPLYVLGLMGATRRLDHYEAATGWQPLFILAAVGVLIILAGASLQILQVIISVFQRKQNKIGDDPWNGRTLEWMTHSPPPVYNFARIPLVHDHDPFWEEKQQGREKKDLLPYEEIHMPKNSPLPLFIGGFSLAFGFAVVWHIFWLMALSFLAILVLLIIRLSDDETEYVISKEEVERREKELQQEAAR